MPNNGVPTSHVPLLDGMARITTSSQDFVPNSQPTSSAPDHLDGAQRLARTTASSQDFISNPQPTGTNPSIPTAPDKHLGGDQHMARAATSSRDLVSNSQSTGPYSFTPAVPDKHLDGTQRMPRAATHPSAPSTYPTAPAVPDKQPGGPSSYAANRPGQDPHPRDPYATQVYAPVIPRRRSPSPDELVEARAQLDALRRTRREDEMAEIKRQIAELQGDKSFRTNDEGMEPRFLPLKARFSAVKPKFFRQIFDNDFDPINITRLCNDVSVSRIQSKYIDLGKNLEVKMKDEDASEFDIKGLATLIRCLGVYCQVKLHFALDEKLRPLSAAFQRYEDHLCKLYATYTWESVRAFHLNFHQMAINDGVDTPENWSRIDTFLENTTLIKRDRPLNSTESRRGSTKVSTNGLDFSSEGKPVCFRFNRGQECARGCTYRHVCQTCSGLHPSKDCPAPSKPPPSASGPASATNLTPVGRRS